MNKWDDYSLTIQKDIFEKVKQFVPINPGANKNNKGFRISKNGQDTGIFKKIEDIGENNIENDIINDGN